MLINRLLTACGRRHFEARQRPETPEWWRHLSVSGSPELCRARTKACKQVWISTYYITKRHYLVKITSWMTQPYQFQPENNLTRGRWLKMAQKLMLKRNYNPHQSRERLYDVRAFQLSPSRLRIASGAAVMPALQ